ncbi:CKLF-like MARVEL transmembrane domain-containing protein 6 [Clarias gariepinus]|uniref:CKLF-like MARVEL transmembrane domain-containing protein 6 n=1 Tax=Clarias gariepinus TaxID=13013 RepID=UPI00234D4D14|nr:CKLF-like MARVEL transmembrane domain-containing protein 6 [Clarias gariepinus]
MASEAVYNSTTTADPSSRQNRCFNIPNNNLDLVRFCLKVLEVLLSFVAFVLEESVNSCTSCSALYFFEFVSCTAFLFTLLLLILLSTPLHMKVGINCWPKLDFVYSVLIFLLLIIASIAFAANNNGTGLENATVGFGFIASFTFLADVLVFYRARGFPFSENPRDPPVGSTEPAQESEKLNANGTNGTN